MSAVRRIGVLTGGGDAPGLNAVIRAVVRSCKVAHGVSVTGILDGFIGLVEMKVRELSLADVSGLLVRGGTVLGTSNRGNPFRYAFRRPDGVEELVDASATAKKNFDKLGLDGLIVIGGDGSLSIAERFWRELGIPVVGVPKTIDNDLFGTEYTFGFATALESATWALDRLHSTAESHHRVMLLEVMGREAGWIALHAGLAGGGDVVLIPEIPFKFDALIAKFRARERSGRPFSVVVVAEGAAPEGGTQVFAGEDAVTGWKRLGGISSQIAREIESRGGYEVRATVLGHIQRGGTPVPTDRILATRFGVEAARLAVTGQFGNMVALRSDEIVAVPIEDTIGRLKRVDPNCQLVRMARSLGIVFGDEDLDAVNRSEG
jgi:phosphofructokinase-like protein